MLFFTMRTPMNAGDCPTVPMLHVCSTMIFQISLPALTRSSSFMPNALRKRSNAFSISGSSGFLPDCPFDAYHLAKAMPMCASAASTGSAWRGNRNSISEPSLAQVMIWFSLLLSRVNARLRSSSLMSTSMPIFFHCCLIISPTCVYGTNCPPTVTISRRTRPLPSGRSR